jgi:hypothetical protein
MSEAEVPHVEAVPPPAAGKSPWPWIELAKVLALPLVTLVLGYWFNSSLNERQQVESNIRLYAEMMGRREEADSNLRKDMFNSILNTFMVKDPSLRLTSEEVIRQQILSLELLAYNFHESLDNQGSSGPCLVRYADHFRSAGQARRRCRARLPVDAGRRRHETPSPVQAGADQL